MHRLSNHPPTVLRNIPANINKRISSISSSEKVFTQAVPLYQEAINKSGHNFQLKFDPKASEKKKRNRNRKKGDVLWFNPPYNSTVSTNIGKEFLKLIDECFPKGHKLRKAFNRHTVKISYSCTPNMQSIISAKNSKILREKEPEIKQCSCPRDKKSECPLGNKCLASEIVYQATIEAENQETQNYIGQTSTDFKHRLATHTFSFNNEEINQTALSQYIWQLKHMGKTPKISWKIVDRGRKFSPVNGVCNLCICEAYYINFHPEMAKLNTKNEIFSSCRHKKPALLIKPKRGRKKKPPGT